MDIVNGYVVGETQTRTQRPKAADKGHSIVKISRTMRFDWRLRTRVTCQCGKVMTGWGDRPYYAHGAHRRAEIGA